MLRSRSCCILASMASFHLGQSGRDMTSSRDFGSSERWAIAERKDLEGGDEEDDGSGVEVEEEDGGGERLSLGGSS